MSGIERIVLGTRNAKKRAEIETILADLAVELRTLDDYPGSGDVKETGATFEANARRKASEYARRIGEWVLAEDSGLEVDALGGLPGVESARYAGPEQDDDKNVAKLLAALEGAPDHERTARYHAVAALADPGGLVRIVAHGRVEGLITVERRGTGGFGYDPVFHYPPFGRTFAQVAPEKKNGVSHRRSALDALHDKLKALVAEEPSATGRSKDGGET